MKPEEIVEVVKASGLRGRGGAGFRKQIQVEFHGQKHRQTELPYL